VWQHKKKPGATSGEVEFCPLQRGTDRVITMRTCHKWKKRGRHKEREKKQINKLGDSSLKTTKKKKKEKKKKKKKGRG